jgi:hypothetical protein
MAKMSRVRSPFRERDDAHLWQISWPETFLLSFLRPVINVTKNVFFFAKNAPANKLDRCHGKVFSADLGSELTFKICQVT